MKFFHAQTLKRRRTNLIQGLEDSQGIWHENEDGIRATAISYFSELFRSSRPSLIAEIEGCMETRVTTEDNVGLTAQVTDAEIKEAAFQILHTRAPRPNDFSGCFYQDH